MFENMEIFIQNLLNVLFYESMNKAVPKPSASLVDVQCSALV